MPDSEAATGPHPAELLSARQEPTWLLWSMAMVALVGGLLARAVEPALPGVWVGADRAITAVKLVAALCSQFYAVVAVVVVVGHAVLALRSTLSVTSRVLAVSVGGLTGLAVIGASAVSLPQLSSFVVAAGAASLGLVVSVKRAAIVTLRGPALVVAGAAFSGVWRIAAMVMARIATASESQTVLTVSRVLATVASLIEIAALFAALAWLAGRSRRSGVPAVLAALALAGALGWMALRGAVLDGTGFDLLVARALRHSMASPAAFGPFVLLAFNEALAWVTVLVLLLFRGATPRLQVVTALALLARGQLEMPLGALSLVVATLVLALDPGPTVEEIRDLGDTRRRGGVDPRENSAKEGGG